MEYKGRKVWITGAASGIGKALALEYSGLGADVILSDRDVGKLKDVVSLCEDRGSEVRFAPFDLEKPDEIKKATAEVLKEIPKLDILICNGGISQRSLAQETPMEIDRKIMEINFFGAVELTKALLPALTAGGGGNIAVTSSMVGKLGFPLRTAYSASKHAIQGYFEALRAELYDQHVKVTIVSPGRIQTSISMNAIDKEGKKHGVLDQGQKNGMPVDRCARKIIRAIRKSKKELWVGRNEILLIYIRLYLPWLFHTLARKIKPM
ncbi:MAG: SDR family oxidoreductase [Bacteroidales bacterium]|jgi:short-subunit dehydrogenase